MVHWSFVPLAESASTYENLHALTEDICIFRLVKRRLYMYESMTSSSVTLFIRITSYPCIYICTCIQHAHCYVKPLHLFSSLSEKFHRSVEPILLLLLNCFLQHQADATRTFRLIHMEQK